MTNPAQTVVCPPNQIETLFAKIWAKNRILRWDKALKITFGHFLHTPNIHLGYSPDLITWDNRVFGTVDFEKVLSMSSAVGLF